MGQHLSAVWSYLPDNSTASAMNTTSTTTSTTTTTTTGGGPTGRPYSYSYSKTKHNNQRKIPKELNENELQQLTNQVLDFIYYWFPEMHERTYFMPPVLMNRVQRSPRVMGTRVLEVQNTPESDWRDDEVMQRTLLCLRALTDRRKEPMVVLLQMQHDNYLNKSCYAAAISRYPRPADLEVTLKRGDFDVLFLHKHHGLLVAEVKSVGWRPGEVQDDRTVRKKVRQAVDQLVKAQTVLRHLVSDLQPEPRITTSLILPNVTSQRLMNVLLDDLQLAKDFLAGFDGTDSLQAAVDMCLCAEQMTSREKPADVTANILNQLEKWWLHLVARGGYKSPNISENQRTEVYELWVARFCGPASTVQVHCVKSPRLELRTLGHAVHEVGERMVEFALFPQQLALLQEDDALVYLTGPPGTGKTLLLILVALKWAKAGQHVHIVSTSTFSEAATEQLFYQVTKTLAEETNPAAESRVHLHLNGNSTKNTPTIVSALIAASGAAAGKGGQLFVVADEVGEQFREAFEELYNNVADLHLWAATYRQEFRPQHMEEKMVTACLRSTPTVVRRMETAVSFENGGVYRYEDKRQEYLSPTEGPAELFLSHVDHESGRAMDCEQCGLDIARLLHNQLHVGKPRSSPKGVAAPPQLQYSDVMIMPDFYQNIPDLHDHTTPTSTTTTTNTSQLDNQAVSLGDTTASASASGIVRGLRHGHVPVFVVTRDNREAIRRLARASLDAVAVVEWGVSNGLERKVVVSVGQGRELNSGHVSGVLQGASRCMSQLVYVTCPEQ